MAETQLDIVYQERSGENLSYPTNLTGPYMAFIPVKATYSTGSQQVGVDRYKKEVSGGGEDEFNIYNGTRTETLTREVDESAPLVSLHIPRGLNFSDNIKYNNIESGLVVSLLEQIRQQGIGNLNFDNAEITAYLARSGIGGEFLSNLRRNNLQTEQNILSPREFVLFDAPTPRSFTMQWKFLPDSQTEVDAVRKIIEFFRKNAYPDFAGETTVIYKFPRAFLIEYIGIDDGQMIKFPELVITAVNVTYNSQSLTYFQSNGQGAPYEVDLSLTFTELVPQSKRDIEAGY